MTCVKCGVGRMLGPTYVRDIRNMPLNDGMATEGLRYYCGHCGWENYTPCRDAVKGGG